MSEKHNNKEVKKTKNKDIKKEIQEEFEDFHKIRLELEHLNKNFKKVIQYSSFKARFLAGMMTGLGGVIGATLLLSILLFILQQVATIKWLEPLVKEVISIVENTKEDSE